MKARKPMAALLASLGLLSGGTALAAGGWKSCARAALCLLHPLQQPDLSPGAASGSVGDSDRSGPPAGPDPGSSPEDLRAGQAGVYLRRPAPRGEADHP